MNTYKLTLLALLASIAVVGRVAFSFLPNIQPVTAMVIICGILLGPVAAILLAVLTTFISNMLLGMGIWTVWQIVSWGLIGVVSGLIGKIMKNVSLKLAVIISIASGFFYGFVISLTQYQITGKFLPYYLAGLPFDMYHALGNAFFILTFYPLFVFFMKKYAKDRFQIQNTN